MFRNKLEMCLKHSCKLVEWFVLLGLLVVTGFFVKEVWNEYVSKETSVKTHFEVHEHLDLPVIVVCFNPTIKRQTMNKYNLSKWQIYRSNLTIYEEGIFKIGRDFNVTFSSQSENFNQESVEVKQMFTNHFGLCHRIVPIFKIRAMERFFLSVEMSEELKNMTSIGFHFTSDQNSFNVMDDRVVGNILHLQTKAVGVHTVMLQKSYFNKLPSISNCSIDNIIPMKCASQRYC